MKKIESSNINNSGSGGEVEKTKVIRKYIHNLFKNTEFIIKNDYSPAVF